jgi:uncharacterized membrane protein YqaE (UPF0057 family)
MNCDNNTGSEVKLADSSANKLVMIILAIILPPLSVFLQRGVGTELVISIVLSIFFYVPGILYALWITLK